MSNLSFTRMWLDLAMGKDKLADFVLGLPPYSEGRPTTEGFVQPELEPNIEVLYGYSQEHKGEGFDKKVEEAVIDTIQENGSSDVVIYHSLIFLSLQLTKENSGEAGFKLDCVKIASVIAEKIRENEKLFRARSMNFGKSVWPQIEYYDGYMKEHFNIGVI